MSLPRANCEKLPANWQRGNPAEIAVRPIGEIYRQISFKKAFSYSYIYWYRDFDALTFEAFLKQLLRRRSRGKRMVVVLDNARYHHAVVLTPLRRKYRRVLTLWFLPPYSPQLAPIERVWKLVRRLATHNRYFATLGERLAAVEEKPKKPNG